MEDNRLKEILEAGSTTEREKLLFDLIRELHSEREKDFFGLINAIQENLRKYVVERKTLEKLVSEISEKNLAETESQR